MSIRAKFSLVLLLSLLLLLIIPFAVRGEDDLHYAGVVVDYADGRIETYCVTFAEDTITGYQLLERAGVEFTAAFDSTGTAVCAIKDVGCPASSCLVCQEPNYWAYWHLQEGAWQYSPIGSSNYPITDGAVDGWAWGNGRMPQNIPLDQICQLPQEEPTSTSTSTSTPTRTPQPPTLTPTPTVLSGGGTPTPQPYVRFTIENPEIQAGACTVVQWQTDNIQAVFLNGRGVPGIGAQSVCPCEATDYVLRVIYRDGTQQDFVVQVTVEGQCNAQPTATPTVTTEVPVTTSPTALPTATSSVSSDTMTSTPAPVAATRTAPFSPLPSPTLIPTSKPLSVAEPAQSIVSTPKPPQTTNIQQASPTSPAVTRQSVDGELPAGRPDRRLLGYLVFGLLLVGIGVGYLVIQGSRQ